MQCDFNGGHSLMTSIWSTHVLSSRERYHMSLYSDPGCNFRIKRGVWYLIHVIVFGCRWQFHDYTRRVIFASSHRFQIQDGLAWLLYKCAALLRTLCGLSETARPLEPFCEERGISSQFRVSTPFRYDLSCWKWSKNPFLPSFLFQIQETNNLIGTILDIQPRMIKQKGG